MSSAVVPAVTWLREELKEVLHRKHIPSPRRAEVRSPWSHSLSKADSDNSPHISGYPQFAPQAPRASAVMQGPCLVQLVPGTTRYEDRKPTH